jgi:hypothetical protein
VIFPCLHNRLAPTDGSLDKPDTVLVLVIAFDNIWFILHHAGVVCQVVVLKNNGNNCFEK